MLWLPSSRRMKRSRFPKIQRMDCFVPRNDRHRNDRKKKNSSSVSTLNTRNSRYRFLLVCYFMVLLELVRHSSPRSSPKNSGADSSRRIWESSDHHTSTRRPRISRTFSHEQKKLLKTNRSYYFSMRSTRLFQRGRPM